MQKHTVIGQRLPSVDGAMRVTGEAVYSADFSLPGMLHGKILRSPHAHARIRRIDYTKALQLPGVRAVVTAGDLRRESAPESDGQQPDGHKPEAGTYDPGHEEEHARGERPNSARTVFAESKALWEGQPVAAVAATTLEVAEQALELIDVSYEVLEPVLSAEQGIKADALLLHPNLFTDTLGKKSESPSNVATHIELERGDIEKGFREADIILEDTYRTRMVHQGYLEPRASLARMDPKGKLTVWTSSQGSFRIQEQVAETLDIPQSRVNVVPLELGGAFGSKGQGVLEPMVALLAVKTGRPVRMVMSRTEEFKAGRPAAPSVVHLKMGAKRDGTLTAARLEVLMEGGAFPGAPVAAATNVGLGVYKIPNFKIDGYDVLTNKPPVGAYRAPGAPQAVFAVEQHMDRLAQELEIDPLELRLKNVTEEGDRIPSDLVMPRVGFRTTLEATRDHPIWKSPPKGPNQGRGLACGMWIGGIAPTSCALKLNGDGSLGLIVGTVDMSGVRTAFTQIVADEFQLDPSLVEVTTLDTDSAPHSSLSAGSKTTYTMSIALKEACDALKAKLLDRAADRLDVPVDQLEYREGVIFPKGDLSRTVTMREIAHASVAAGGGPIMAPGAMSRARQTPIFAAHVVDVEVDPGTGKVTILGFWAFQDCGLAVNPSQVEGQMQGGATQGIGWALTEEYAFEEGVMRNPSFLDYRMPTALDVPFIDCTIIEVPSSDGPYGIRGVGEVPIVPPMAAIANAIADATGVRLNELPMSPEAVFWAMHGSDG